MAQAIRPVFALTRHITKKEIPNPRDDSTFGTTGGDTNFNFNEPDNISARQKKNLLKGLFI